MPDAPNPSVELRIYHEDRRQQRLNRDVVGVWLRASSRGRQVIIQGPFDECETLSVRPARFEQAIARAREQYPQQQPPYLVVHIGSDMTRITAEAKLPRL